ncbi:MAG: acetate/propionate family kinase, partial [Anaerolineales bacterium]|nr:acetate/propionate family kinase [Anaerolineales bacterium]
APLHNPANVLGIKTAQALFPDTPQVAVFDTAFHQTLPSHAYLYAIPYELYEEQAVRRYGFHGTSHRYVTQKAAELLGQPYNELALISAHLGNGCSATAVLDGRSIDTTLGLTPLEGLVMGTRSGDVDPSLHQFLRDTVGYDLDQTTTMLNKQSGLLGLSGLSNDMRTLIEAAAHGHERAQLALNVFVYRLAKAIGALAVPLGRIDALIFTGGIGEHAALIRQWVIEQLTIFGFELDKSLNKIHGQGNSGIITAPNSPVAMVIPTDEEVMIARDSLAAIQL